MRVLVVEDDVDMGKLLEQALLEEGDTVVLEKNGMTGLQLARSGNFDVILLDVMLPGLDGFGVVHQLRQQGCQTPVLILTARDTTRDIVHGLNSGADDYLTKPFVLEVLIARLRAVARRGMAPQSLLLSAGDLTMNTGTREVFRGKRSIELTRTEYGILELLLRNVSRIVSREQIIAAVWGYDTEVENATLDTFVHLLRRKVDLSSDKKLIHTSRGVGYFVREGR